MSYFWGTLAVTVSVFIISCILDRNKIKQVTNSSYSWIDKKRLVSTSIKSIFAIAGGIIYVYFLYYLINSSIYILEIFASNAQLFSSIENQKGLETSLAWILFVSLVFVVSVGLPILNSIAVNLLTLINQIIVLQKQRKNDIQVKLNHAIHSGNIEQINSVYYKVTNENLSAKLYVVDWFEVVRALLLAGHLKEAERLNTYLDSKGMYALTKVPVKLYDDQKILLENKVLQ